MNKQNKRFAVLTAGAAAVAAVVYLGGDWSGARTPLFAGGGAVKDPAEQFASICEEQLQDRLLAPSTYRRVEVNGPVSGDASFEEFRGWLTEEQVRKARADIARDPDLKRLNAEFQDMFKRKAPTRVDLVLIYEAQNGFGVPIRRQALCTRIVGSEEEMGEPENALDPVYVDLETNLDWSLRKSLDF